MAQYTFKVDNQDPLYKKLIKLPTAYYRLKNNSNGYTIYSHNNGTVEIKDIHNVKLKWENDKIFLYEGDLALKLNGQDFVIEQEAIISEDKEAIVKRLQELNPIGVVLQDMPGGYCGIQLSISRSSSITGVLNFINFCDENDPVLKKIKEETGGLYLTMKDNDTDCSRTVYISDKNGNHLPTYNDYQYQYKPNVAELEAIDSLINEKQKFTLQKGEKLLDDDDIYEANIVLNGKLIATVQKIGYYILNDQLVMHNRVTQEKVIVPRDFHFLKVVKLGIDDYRLTFCNAHGNEFFEYKRYDPQYLNISDEHKFISLHCVKKFHNLNLQGLLSHQPSFFLVKESVEPGSPDQYSVAMFELIDGEKGKKMAMLIDEFGYFNENGKFKRCDYHEEMEYHVYDPSEINIEKNIW